MYKDISYCHSMRSSLLRLVRLVASRYLVVGGTPHRSYLLISFATPADRNDDLASNY